MLREIHQPDFKKIFRTKYTVYGLEICAGNSLELTHAANDVVFRICHALYEQNNLSDTLLLLAYFSDKHGLGLSTVQSHLSRQAQDQKPWRTLKEKFS